MRPHYCQKVPTRLNSLDPPVWHRWSFFHSLTRLGPVRKLIRGWPQVWETARSVSLAPATGGLFYNWCDASRNPDCVVCDKRWWETMIEKERECERKNEQLRVCASVRESEREREKQRRHEMRILWWHNHSFSSLGIPFSHRLKRQLEEGDSRDGTTATHLLLLLLVKFWVHRMGSHHPIQVLSRPKVPTLYRMHNIYITLKKQLLSHITHVNWAVQLALTY